MLSTENLPLDKYEKCESEAFQDDTACWQREQKGPKAMEFSVSPTGKTQWMILAFIGWIKKTFWLISVWQCVSHGNLWISCGSFSLIWSFPILRSLVVFFFRGTGSVTNIIAMKTQLWSLQLTTQPTLLMAATKEKYWTGSHWWQGDWLKSRWKIHKSQWEWKLAVWREGAK